MSGAATAGICLLVLVGGGAAIYAISRASKAPITAVVQSPTPAVAGIQALGQLASKGIDAWIAAKVNKDEDE